MLKYLEVTQGEQSKVYGIEENVCQFDCAQVNPYAKLYQILHFKYMSFVVHQIYFKKVKEGMGREKFRNSEYSATKGNTLEETVEKQDKNLRENQNQAFFKMLEIMVCLYADRRDPMEREKLVMQEREKRELLE